MVNPLRLLRFSRIKERLTLEAKYEFYFDFIAIACFYSAIAYGILSWFIDFKEGTIQTLVTFTGLSLLLSLDKKRFGYNFRINFFTGICFMQAFGGILLTGGFTSSALPWLLFIPFIPRTTGTKRVSSLWTYVCVIGLLVVYILAALDIHFTTSFQARYQLPVSILLTTMLMGIVILFISYIDHFNTASIQLLEDKNEELDRIRKELLASQKFRDQFIANVSHELRTPMNAILGVTDILQKDEKNLEKLELLDGMKTSADNLLVLINDVLDLTRIRAGNLKIRSEVFNLRQLADSLRLLFQMRTAEKNISFLFSFSPQLPDLVVGDTARINQVLVNLLGNAIKFTEKGEVELLLEKAEISNTNSQLLKITVRDSGTGIAPEHIKHIFDNFYQVDAGVGKNTGGTGLGLAITRQIIELMNGKIEVQSVLDKGSVFSVFIPLVIAKNTGVAQPKTVNGEVIEALRHIRILLVEDSQINRLVAIKQIQTLLPEAAVTIAENGEQAVALAAQNNFDIILMDIMLPGISGIEASKQIRRFNNSIPIVALTANIFENELEEYSAVKMNGTITKPFNKEELVVKIFEFASKT